MQNVAAKLVLQKRKYDHVTPLLVKLHWLPIHLRIEFKLLVLTFKCIHKLAPSYLSDMLHVREATYTTRSSHTLHLHVPRTHLKYAGDRAFSAAAPRLWNNIPVELRRIDSLSHFKTMLKTHLFSKAYWCVIVPHDCFNMYIRASTLLLSKAPTNWMKDVWRYISAILLSLMYTMY